MQFITMFHLWTAGSRLSPFAEPTCHGRVATMSSRIMLTRITMTDLEFLGMVTKPEVAPQLQRLAKFIPFSCSSNTKAGQFRVIRWHVCIFLIHGSISRTGIQFLERWQNQSRLIWMRWINSGTPDSGPEQIGPQWWVCWSQAAYSNEDQNSALDPLHFVLLPPASNLIDCTLYFKFKFKDFDWTFDLKPCVENSSTAKKMHLVAVVHQGLACKCLCSH